MSGTAEVLKANPDIQQAYLGWGQQVEYHAVSTIAGASAGLLNGSGERSRSDLLDGECYPLTAADAHGDQPVAPAGALQVVERLHRQDRAGGADRMAERDGRRD